MADSIHDQATCLDALTWILQHWDTSFLRVKQDGKMRTLSLVEIEDQTVILKYVTERLREWGEERFGRVARPYSPRKGRGYGSADLG